MLSSELVQHSLANTGTWVWEECWQGDELIKVELCHHLLQESEMRPSLRRILVQAAVGRISHWSSALATRRGQRHREKQEPFP
ncbi:hypothetical protein DV515_00007594 [Chloebia gouldiae]|uniref:Uncharacterized protein n=1 Tax=Chloebia gouldiae TaxID=44316 RepID=A0A3L8SIK2_CHLGU|nr:hypothetical protein DV515_00007594 [Chloebia gouldiae]